MKGIIFNLLEKYIIFKYGEDFYDDLIFNCNLITKDPFVAPGNYDDKDFYELIQKACDKINVKQEDFLLDFGRFATSILYQKYPSFFDGKTFIEFLKTLDFIHNIEVAKLYDNIHPPKFTVIDIKDNSITLEYVSSRDLCPFMEGLILGLEKVYNIQLLINKVHCKKISNNGNCVIEVKQVL